MKLALFSLSFIISQISFSQWSTKPYADSGLDVCPGFNPGIVTFDDGSSIVLGLLSSYIYAQKLDPAGYKVWPQPIMVFHNDSSDISVGSELSAQTWFCSDDDGGVILYWEDYRGAYYTQDGAKNGTTYLQRVDKDGNVRWGNEGIQVNDLMSGLKDARIATDDSGGCVLIWTEWGFNYPGAPNKNYLKFARYDANGNRLWMQIMDSTFSGTDPFYPYDVTRGGEYYYFRYAIGSAGNYQKAINNNGELSSAKTQPISEIEISKDQNIFFSDLTVFPTHVYKISKVNYQSDTNWVKTFSFQNYCSDKGGMLIPDNKGGTYLTHVCNDTLLYFDSLGNLFFKKYNDIDFGIYFFPDGDEGLLVINSTTARRYDSSTKMIWSDSVVFLSDPGNAYSPYFKPDNNGGLIIAYWSTQGGIYAQHTGRLGKLGIISNVKNKPIQTPVAFKLLQNYPNPFNGLTQIQYSLDAKSKIRLNIYDVLGKKVATIVDATQEKGTYSVNVELPNSASGAYFYRLMNEGKIQITRKMLLAK